MFVETLRTFAEQNTGGLYVFFMSAIFSFVYFSKRREINRLKAENEDLRSLLLSALEVDK